MEGYQDLIAWQKAMDFVVAVYQATAAFPRDEQFGLTAQLRRATVSIPSNIAEGQGRNSRREFHHFLGNARGSLFEVETQLNIAARLNYISTQIADQLLQSASLIGRLLNGLREWALTNVPE